MVQLRKTDKLRKWIQARAAEAGIDLARTEAYMKFKPEGDSWMPLVIESQGHGMISVTHYFEQNGDLVPDPDVTIFMATPESWYPCTYQDQRHYGVYLVVTNPRLENSQVVDARMQRDLADFCDTWGENLEAQGYADALIKTQPGWTD